MVCSACGKEIPNDSTFCPECGNKMPRQFTVARPQLRKQKTCTSCKRFIPADSIFCPECGQKQNQIPLAQQAVLSPEELKAMKLRAKRLGMAAAAVLILCLVIGILSAVIKPSVNLNKYITVSFSGFDTIGEARLEFDEKQFAQDHGENLAACLDELRQKEQDHGIDSLMDQLMGNEAAKWDPEDAARRFVSDCVRWNLDVTSQLSNGDVVTCVWECDAEKAMEKYGYKLKYKDAQFTAADLQIPETFDPFEGFSLVFEGIAPQGTVQVTNVAYKDLRYELDQWQNLDNGDSVTVTVGAYYYDDLNTYCLNLYEKIPSVTTKTFTVEGLSNYITSASQISEESLKAMQTQAEDTYAARAAKDWKRSELVGMEYVGNYLLLNKNPDTGYNRNLFYMVYKVKVSNHYSVQKEQEDGTTTEKAYDEENEIYWYLCYRDVVAAADGSIVADLTKYDTPSDSVTIDSKIKEGNSSVKTWTYKGYATLEELYRQVVSINLEGYTHEDNMPQKN